MGDQDRVQPIGPGRLALLTDVRRTEVANWLFIPMAEGGGYYGCAPERSMYLGQIEGVACHIKIMPSKQGILSVPRQWWCVVIRLCLYSIRSYAIKCPAE